MTGLGAIRTGRQGEKLFSLLCTKAGVTCNPSQEDDQGWDWILEFPAGTSKKPIDLQPAPKTAFVQVKTTRSDKRSCRIKLSNALRMAKSTHPYFVVLIVLNGDGEPYRIYVAHIWDRLIAQFLKEGRLADSEGATALNRRLVTVAMSDEDAKSNPIAWIGAQIDAAGADYAGAKRAIADTVGFEDGYGKVNVEVELDDPDDFLNLQLGLKDGLRFTRFTYTSERFGVPAGKAEIDGDGGTLHITPTPRQGVLRLSTTAGDELILNAKVVSADEPGEPGRWRTRIAAGCFDMIIGKGAARASATLKDDERHTLEHIGSFTTLLRWHDRGAVDIRLQLDGNMLELGTMDLSSSRLRGWDNIALGADVLRAVAKAALRDDVLLSVQEIHAAAPDLDLMSALASDRVLKIEFTPQPGAPERFTGMLAYTGADVGEWACLAIVYRPVADDIRDGEKRSLIFQPGRIVEARMVPGRSVDHIEEFARKYATALDRLSETGEMLDVGEFRRFVRRQAA